MFILQMRLVRQVGKTYFARAEIYEAFTLTDRHRDEFFRDGAALLKGVLKPEVVKKLHENLLPIPEWDSEKRLNLWMQHDEILDFTFLDPWGTLLGRFFRAHRQWHRSYPRLLNFNEILSVQEVTIPQTDGISTGRSVR